MAKGGIVSQINKQMEKYIDDELQKYLDENKFPQLATETTAQHIQDFFTQYKTLFANWLQLYQQKTYAKLRESAKSINTLRQSKAYLQDNLERAILERGLKLLENFEHNFNIKIDYILAKGIVVEGKPEANIQDKYTLQYKIVPLQNVSYKPQGKNSTSQITFLATDNKSQQYNHTITWSDTQNSIAGQKKEVVLEYQRLSYIQQMIAHWSQVAMYGSSISNANQIGINAINAGYANQQNMGYLGEGVINSELLKNHIASIAVLYFAYASHKNLGTARTLFGRGESEELILKDLAKIIDCSNPSGFFTTGDFEYRDIWETLYQHQNVFRKLIDSQKPDSLPMQKMLDLYNEYKDVKYQIKLDQSGNVKGQSIHNYIKYLYNLLENDEFFKKITSLTKEDLEKLFYQTTAQHTDDYAKKLAENLGIEKLPIDWDKNFDVFSKV